MKKPRLQFLLFFSFYLLIELTFRLQSSYLQFNSLLLRNTFSSLFIAAILTGINKHWKNIGISIITILSTVFVSVYAFVQISMKNYYGAFFSSRFITQEIPAVQSYANDFMASLKLQYFIYFVYLIIFIILYFVLLKRHIVTKVKYHSLKNRYISILAILVYGLLLFWEPQAYLESSSKLLMNPFYTEAAMNQLGLNPFIISDLQYVITPSRAVQKIEEIPVEPEPEKPVEPIKDPMLREFDDSQWRQVMDVEENESFKQIDQYFMNQTLTKKNDMTGIFEGKNIIYFLVEAFDELAIHPDITPTLYKMKDEGLYFNQFFSPQYNCATAESELMSVSSLYPVVGTCTMSNYYRNTNVQTVYNLFKNKGYETRSFHNWNDQFYPRTQIHPFLGSNLYKDEPQTIPSRVSGWQSDLTMIHTVTNDLNAIDGPFMSYVITSTTHFPYDVDTELGNKYLDRVNSSLPDAPMDIKRYLSKAVDLDNAVNYLLENLDDMDNTVFVFFSDHTPFKLNRSEILANTHGENKGQFSSSTPMMIYTPNGPSQVVSKVSSSIDLVPTIANLFNLNHDPRVFMGSDIFSDTNNLVIMQNGSWYDQVGYYDASKANFKAHGDKTYSADEISTRNAQVKQKLAISSSIYMSEYFSQRAFLLRED